MIIGRRAREILGSSWLAVKPELASGGISCADRCKPDHRVCALLGRTQQWPHDLAEPRKTGVDTGRFDPARVDRMKLNIGAPTRAEVVDELDLTSLRSCIGDGSPVVALGHLDLVDVETLGVHAHPRT